MVVDGVERTVVLVDGLFLEGREVALVNSQLAIELVARFDEAVEEVAVNLLRRYVQAVGGMLEPLPAAAGVERHGEVFPLVLFKQFPPLRCVELQFAVRSGGGKDLHSAAGNAAHEGVALRGHLDVERGYVGRDDDVAVVRVDGGLLLRGLAVGGNGRLGAASLHLPKDGKPQGEAGEAYDDVLHVGYGCCL